MDVSSRSLHHVALVVNDLETAVATYEILGFGAAEQSLVPDQAVRVATIPTGSTWLELIQPTDPAGPIARFLAKRGEGFHHLAYRVGDLANELGRLEERGVRLIDRVPRRGVHNWSIAFVHPESCGGVLIELVEDSSTDRA